MKNIPNIWIGELTVTDKSTNDFFEEQRKDWCKQQREKMNRDYGRKPYKKQFELDGDTVKELCELASDGNVKTDEVLRYAVADYYKRHHFKVKQNGFLVQPFGTER